MSWMKILNASWWIGLLILSGIPVFRDAKEHDWDPMELNDYSTVWTIIVGIVFLSILLVWTVKLYR